MTKETISFFINKKITAQQLARVFESSGIVRPYKDLARLQKMIDHGDIMISAWEGELLIGIARALTDYSYACYLSDLAVDKAYQKQGIGKELIHLLQKEIGEEVALILLAAPNAMDYYPSIGFEKVDNAYRIQRKK